MLNSKRLMFELGVGDMTDESSKELVTPEKVLLNVELELLNIEIQDREVWIKKFEAIGQPNDDTI